MTDKGQLGAFITKVKKGSIADTVGHLRAGEIIYSISQKVSRILSNIYTNLYFLKIIFIICLL